MFEDVPAPDVRSDVFSLAATIHTVLAGRTPFEVPGGPNGTLELIARIERGELTPMTRDDVPATLSAVLAKGLSPRRDNRYASAIEFARALQRVELELGYAPTTIDVPLIDDEPGAASGEGEETSLRKVRQVIAQPVSPIPSPADREQNRMGATTIGVAGAADGPLTAPPSRRRILIGVLVGFLALPTDSCASRPNPTQCSVSRPQTMAPPPPLRDHSPRGRGVHRSHPLHHHRHHPAGRSCCRTGAACRSTGRRCSGATPLRAPTSRPRD